MIRARGDRRRSAVQALQAELGHDFRDPDLLDRAVTHASAGPPQGRHNERLEFLGDRVLGLVAAERLFDMRPEVREGEMSQRLAGLVSRAACALAARRMGLAPALRLSPGEAKTGGRDKDNILADACEAVIAAIYIDGGLDACRAIFDRFWADELAGAAVTHKDPKTELQEWSQARALGLPEYRVAGRTGQDHAPVFTVTVAVGALSPETADGASRHQAEMAAARRLLARVREAS